MKLSAFSKTYEGRCVLDFPGIELQPGKIYAVIGANGSGKNYAYRMSTRKNILLNGKDEARAVRMMDAIQIRHLENKRADKLSGGETARMALVRLMMKSYDLVLLDEPTAAMDMETTLLSEKLIVDYVRETGCALILVTHSLQQARRIADEVWYFHKGALLETGSREKVLCNPERAETRQFLEFYGV